MGKYVDEFKLFKVFFVNWFCCGDDGCFLWLGFGENSWVLKWIVDCIEYKVGGVIILIGIVFVVEDLDLDGLDVDVVDVVVVLVVDVDEWC